MSSKSNRSASTPAVDPVAAQNATADLARQQLAVASEATSNLLRSWETMQLAQQHMVQRVALMHEQTAAKLRSTTSLGELMAIQSGLLMSGVQEAAQYAQELMMAGFRVQTDLMMRSTEQQQAPAAAAAAATTTTNNAAGQMMQAWQTLFTAPLNGAASHRSH